MPPKKDEKLYNGRDELFVKIKQGVTKAGVHKDRKKEKNKQECRKKVDKNEL